MHGQHRWAVVIDWPDGAAEDVQRMKTQYVAVRLEYWNRDEEEPNQFWPRAHVRRDGEPDRSEPKSRPFSSDD